ncbi:MAG: DUF4332 domain-containing protein [Gemmatimonadales bacterium]
MKFARSRRLVNRSRPPHGTRSIRVSVVVLVIALAVLAFATLAAARNVQPFFGWYYHWAWYPMLIALGAGYAAVTGRWPVSPRLAISLLFWSAPLWFFFELVNFRLANWYYVFAAEGRAARVLGAFTAFATVLPAIYLSYRWVQRLGIARGWAGPKLPLSRHSVTVVGAGFALLVLALWQPRLFFPLVWGFLTLVLEPWNYRHAPERSLLGDLELGRYARISQILVAGAAVGLAWEAFNSLAGARWIYTVPGLEGHKLFEMPLPGFLGFPVFALDCFVVYQALVNVGLAAPGWGGGFETARPGSVRTPMGFASRSAATTAVVKSAAVAGALVFGVFVALGLERWTIDSTYPDLEALPGITSQEIRSLQAVGVRSVEALSSTQTEVLTQHGIEVDRAINLVATAGLTAHRGIGAENAAALGSAGIPTICALARADAATVSRAVRAVRADPRAGSTPRVRVWIRSAARACATG